ncbi:YcbK family protein [Shinella pollutisoli]|uniref:YcbK family protein n=1 Tax=Shinella pollutisoli TaxID=2250594 RepID=A0ABV7DCN1_9HYPH|nr:YcbK family protein [Shinella pollutisoli]
MQDKPGPRQGLKPYSRGLLLAVSLAALTGCVSAMTTDMRAENVAAPAQAGADDEGSATASLSDAATETAQTPDAHAATGAAADTAGMTETQAGADGADMAGLVMQPTTLNAGQASIYSTGGQATAGSAVPAYTTQTSARNAAVNSIYAGSAASEDATQGGRLPVEDMPALDPAAQRQSLPLAGDDQSSADPAAIPAEKTARTALVDEDTAANPAQEALSSATDRREEADVTPLTATTGTAGRRKLTLSSLFGAKRQAGAQIDANAEAAQPRRVINRDSAGALRTASLGGASLPGVSVADLPAADDSHSEAEEAFDDDEPRFKEVASLAGLARLAPNGLWLQTEKVRTGCFKPELLSVLKTVEQHYGKPVIVTSGLRGMKRNRARQSLHTRCEAADIQIAGVGKWELAEYLRSMPGRGGVGTYCHTESVHIDIGPERDWNWRCRRRK